MTDWQLKKDILNVVKDRFSRIDIVMQQCVSGGFLNDVSQATGVPRTFASSAAWNEISWNVVQAENTSQALWNFTNEWQAAARANPRPGVREIAYRARQEDWVGPVSQAFKPSVAEHPQYYSPDNPAGGANDTAALGAQTGVKQYAILAGWGREETLYFRHQVNTARMYDLLRNEYQVPADQIAVIWGNGTYPTLSAPNVIRPGAQNLGQVPLNLLTSRTNWLAALKGTQFGTPSTPNDKLLVYFTGHGGHAEWRRDKWQSLDKNGDHTPDGVRWRVSLQNAPNAFTGAPPSGGGAEASANPQMLGDRDEDGMDHIQLHFRQGLSFNLEDENHASLIINDVDVTGLVRFVSGTEVLNIPPRREGTGSLYTTFVYQVDVPRSLVLGLDPDQVTIDLEDVAPELAYQDLLMAADFRGGDHEYLFVNVPEPGTALLLLLAAALQIACRRPRQE